MFSFNTYSTEYIYIYLLTVQMMEGFALVTIYKVNYKKDSHGGRSTLLNSRS